MSSDTNKFLDFSSVLPAIQSKQIWSISADEVGETCDPPQATFDALLKPEDFPPLEAAIVPGDRVALAVDPNVPAVSQIVLGAIKAIGLTQSDAIDIVLGDEACDQTVTSVRDIAGEQVNVVVHQSSKRDSLRFVAPNASADPIYLNRYLVDADFVLPIAPARSSDGNRLRDVTNVFPDFADSASRYRSLSKARTSGRAAAGAAWQLGIHVMISVSARKDGSVLKVIASTPFGAQQAGKPSSGVTNFPEPPALVIVSLDGDAQQQSWANAARALAVAAECIAIGGTIVVWTKMDTSPAGQLLSLASNQPRPSEPEQTDDGFPAWDGFAEAADTFQRIGEEYRVMIHSQIDRETIESMGLGVIGSVDELSRLSSSFDTCGVIRAAQFGMPIRS